MDTIATIIVTAFLTSLITGIVSNFIFLRYQKKVEASFAKQLEEFRANLQYSNFEQQIKFARLHEKRVQTLEALYQKYKIFRDTLYKWIESINLHMMGDALLLRIDIDRDRHLQQQSEVRTKLNDCLDYFETNRLLFSVDLVNEIWHIFFEAGNAHSLISMALDPDELPSSLEAWSNYRAKIEGFYVQVDNQTAKLENLYRSTSFL